MKIKKNGKVINLTESDLKRIVKKVLKENVSYPCASAFGVGLTKFSNVALCKKYPEKCKNKEETKSDNTKEETGLNKEVEELINGTKLMRLPKGFIFIPPSKYPNKVDKGWTLYSEKLGKYFTYKSGKISNNILSMTFTIPHGYGGAIKKLVDKLSLPNYITISFITNGTKDCYGYFDCDDVKITIDLNKKGGCSKPDFANMVIDGKPMSLGVDKNYIQLKSI